MEVAERILAGARPGEDVEVYCRRGRSSAFAVYDGEVESQRSGASSGVGVRVADGGRVGFAWAGSLDEIVIAEVLADAREHAGLSEPEESAGLAAPDGVPPVILTRPVSDLSSLNDRQKLALALDLEAAVRSADPRVSGVRTCRYGDGWAEVAVASTTGISVWSESSVCSVSVSALARDRDETQIGYGFHAAHDPADLDAGEAARDAVDRALGQLGAVKPLTARIPVMFERRAAASLLGVAAGMLTGERVAKGRTPFSDRMGEQIASEAVSLVDDPTDERGFAADAYDAEGLASRRNILVADGVLTGFLNDSHSGRRLGSSSTGSAVRSVGSTPSPGVRALALTPGSESSDVLISGVELGVWVTELAGLHSGVNAVSGDFSVGVQGRMIRDGELAEPVREATVASTVPRLLLDVTAIADDLEWLPGGSGAASMLVSEASLSGT